MPYYINTKQFSHIPTDQWNNPDSDAYVVILLLLLFQRAMDPIQTSFFPLN